MKCRDVKTRWGYTAASLIVLDVPPSLSCSCFSVAVSAWHLHSAPTHAQAEEARAEHMAYLTHHLKQNTCHLLLEGAEQEGTEEKVGGEQDGTGEVATDAYDDFFESLSATQLSRVRNQTLAVRMYLMNLDRHHPKWSVDECAADVAETLGYTCSGRTIQNWFREYANNGNRFELDGRGKDVPDWILDQLTEVDADTEGGETLESIFRRWIKSNLKEMSIARATAYLNDELFKSVPLKTFKTFHVSYPIAPSVAYTWMIRVGCERSVNKKNYYVDRHEAPDVVKYRNSYVRRDLERELRQPVWIQLTEAEEAVLREDMRAAGGSLPPGHRFERGGGVFFEFHVDDSDAFLQTREKFMMGGNLSVRFPAGQRPLIRQGQDESIYKAYQFPSGTWECEGVMAIRPKTEGVGDMVSAFTDTARGFGLPMSEAELAQVNALRRSCDYASVDSAIAINGTASKPPLPLPDDFRSPGIRFLKYGQNKEGYWDYDRMALQMEDVLDCVGVVYGASSAAVADAKARAPPEAEVDWSRGFATLQEMDWSSGHGRKKPDGLDAAKMNEKFGGAQPRMHSTTVSAGDIGPYEAKLTLVTPRGAKKIIDCKVKPGQVQQMVFQNRGGLEHHGHVVPPHYAPDTPKDDVDLGYQKAKRKKKRKAGADGGATAAEEEPEMEDAVTPGYVDKKKGLRQVLWERGWICPGKNIR